MLSTLHNLVSVRESHVVKTLLSFQNKNLTAPILCDLTKAFDCVSRKLLMSKLEYYGIQNSPMELIWPYLSNRKQIVSIKRKISNACSAKCGVSQGSFNTCLQARSLKM